MTTVTEQIKRLRQWRDLYPTDYIRHHFIICNYDGEVEALIDEVERLQKKVSNLRSALFKGKRG